MSKKTIIIGATLLILIAIAGCTKNKFKITRSQPTDIPYYNPVNDTCFICHNVSTLKKTIQTALGAEVVPLYVNRDKFARSIHRGIRCLDCHTDIVKGHTQVPKTYGGWANFSAEDTILTRNYTTQASIACVNCHTGRSEFLSSQHYLIEDIKNSHKELNNGIEIGKDYDKAKCGKCHLTCATCHFKGAKVQTVNGEITDPPYWSDLLNGVPVQNADGLTNWAIDWTTNVESHDFAIAEDLQGSNDLCRVCHTGFYTNYSTTGYYHPDGFQYWDSLTSQGIEKYPQYEEWRFLSGQISVNTGNPFLDDTVYNRIENDEHYPKKCVNCHNHPPADIHSLSIPTCKDAGCHKGIKFAIPGLHQDVACVACHDATMDSWRDPNSGDTVRVAAVKDNKILNWHSHMIIKPRVVSTNFCDRKCHNPETGPRIGAPWSYHHTGGIH